MLKKSLFLASSFIALFAATTLSSQYLAMAVTAPASVAEKAAKTETEPEPKAEVKKTEAIPVWLDRSGMDRASVHLQILQQSNERFVEAKKMAIEEKKAVTKSRSNI